MQTNDLMNRALTAEPFECKDIEIALHEIRQMQKDIEKLQTETNERTNIIQNLIEEREELKRQIVISGITTERPRNLPRDGGSLFCVSNKCYTPTEFALFGVGTTVMGIMIGVIGISWFKSHCLPDEKEELRERERELQKQERLIKSPNYLLNGSEKSNIYPNYSLNGSAVDKSHLIQPGEDQIERAVPVKHGLHETEK
ncbi:uncharacterized protein LOC111699120 isoform X2 [Eurytemora carolleeae]|uniref:uncharacterized protein LOC111699120 isoform X2 n=1 Tax=Eurytemora carolleeae TaxID=1294199 RepID=UPI000C75CEA8|nr:uncharacterized protein LOC111699120 isoform X2 [Eurytemora carolleeae]|eukprot:XP_023325464.1 uncharacterized protein LOC111699120 isoform X2 [Eurytemora affinis]